jgi:hypothetical protein
MSYIGGQRQSQVPGNDLRVKNEWNFNVLLNCFISFLCCARRRHRFMKKKTCYVGFFCSKKKKNQPCTPVLNSLNVNCVKITRLIFCHMELL